MTGFTIDETGAANLFVMSRGRGGSNELEDRNVLAALLREFAMEGVRVGLKRSKVLFQRSTDASGGCMVLSQGDKCNCFLCLVDRDIEQKGTNQ